MRNNTKVWENLVEKVSPVTVSDDPIERIIIHLEQGGVKATASIPNSFNTKSQNNVQPEEQKANESMKFEKSDVEEEDYERNGSVFIYEDFGIEIKQKILEALSDAIVDASIPFSYNLVRCTVTKETINPVFEISHRTSENWIKDDLAEVLSEEGRIDKKPDLAFGRIDNVYKSEGLGFNDEDSEGWEFDGTLYRYTHKPFEYWSQPDNMNEWVDFASDSEDTKQVVRDRDEHLVHFHPMKHQLDDNHPYIQWFKKVEHHSVSEYTLDYETVESFKLAEVSVDDTGAVLSNTMIL